MRYIKTGGRIIDTEKWLCIRATHTLIVFVNQETGESVLFHKGDPIDEADDPAQLCYEFICEQSLVEERVIRDESGKAIDKRHKRDEAISLAKMDLDVYGALWTKGPQGEPILKSVVKISKEGEGILL